MKGYKRRTYIVDKRYQGKFVFTVLCICSIGMIAALFAFNYFSFKNLDSTVWRVHIDASTVGEIVKPYLIFSNLFALSLTAAILIAFSRFVLVKTAPPLFRLQRYIEKTGEGNLTADLEWLAVDEFKETAGELDYMVVALRDKFTVVKEKAKDVETASEALHYLLDKPESLLHKCQNLKNSLQSLKESLLNVKTSC